MMNKIGLMTASVAVASSLLLSGCTSGDDVPEDNGLTNGQSTTNPYALPETYEIRGGAADWSVDESGFAVPADPGPDDSTTQTVPAPAQFTPEPMAQPEFVDEVTATPQATEAAPAEVEGEAPDVGQSSEEFAQATRIGVPSDEPIELRALDPLIVTGGGFKSGTTVYLYLWHGDAQDYGDVIASGIANESGDTEIQAYMSAGFKPDANYTLRLGGVDGSDKGFINQAPIRLVQ